MREAVIGREHRIDALVGVVGREQVVHAGLRHGAVPTERADLVHARLAGLHHQLAAVDVGLQDRHGAVIEEEGVVVVRRTAEQLDVERTLAVLEAERIDQRGRLQHADLEVVEGRVVIDIRRLLDQAVIGDDLDAAVMRLSAERRRAWCRRSRR